MSRLLVDAALRSLALALVVWVAIWILRPQSVRLRVAAWTLVLIAAMAMPLLTRWHVFEIPSPLPLTQTARLSPSRVAIGQAETRSRDVQSYAAPSKPKRGIAVAWALLTLVAYLTVGSLLLVRIVIGLFLTHRTWRRATPISAAWAVSPPVREASDVSAPAATGSGILFPEDWLAWDETKLRAVLAHERSHIIHGDFYVRLLARLHAAVFWFSPLAWWLSHELADLLEAASDDDALAVFTDNSLYAEILLFFAGRQQHGSFTLAMARMSTVTRRVERVLAHSSAPSRASGKQYAAVAACVVVITAFIACSSVRAQTAAGPESAEPGRNGEPFVIVSGDSTTASGSSEDGQSARSLRGRYTGDYLWFLRGGKSYVITDSATLAKAKDLFRPQEELGRQQEALGAQQEKLGSEQAKLGEQQARVSVRFPDMEAETREIEQELDRAHGASVAEAKTALRGLEEQLKEAKNKQLTQEKISRMQERVSELQSHLADSRANLESRFGRDAVAFRRAAEPRGTNSRASVTSNRISGISNRNSEIANPNSAKSSRGSPKRHRSRSAS